MQMRHQPAAAIAVIALMAMTGCNGNKSSPGLPPVSPPPTAGDTIALTSSNRIITFNRSSPAVRTAIQVTGLQGGESLLGIDTRPGGTPGGELYALGSSGRVYTINISSGAATVKATLSADASDTTDAFTALSGADFGVDFNPVPDRLRVVSNTGQNLRINVDTGATITDGALNAAGSAVTGISAVAYTNSFAAACRTQLFYIDITTDRLLTTTDPNNGLVTMVGALGVDADASNGVEILTAADGSNSAFATLTVGGTARVYTINLTTGVATDTGAITGLNAETIRGMAITPLAATPTQAQGDVLALTESNRLVSFTNGAPQKLCTSVAIAGMQANENMLGIDVRPADGGLYAVGSTGRIYTVDRASGAATLKATLAADPADASDPFTALSGADFGVDFNPVPDRLRVVSNTGQNLRINVDTGAATTDTPLNPAGSAISAAAYTNSFAGAGTTTLYVLDATNDRLLIQGQPSGNPNNGDLLNVGSLGLSSDVQTIGGFDINARNVTAYAAFTLTGATSSELHTINLATGAATRTNAIGGGERIRGLTLSAAVQASVLAVTADHRLVSFKTVTPATFDTNVAITGLQSGENVIALDVRPANARLYALTDAGRLYTLDATSAAATLVTSLSADAGDATIPFATLSGTAFGADFNPVVDRLRTVTNAGQNLRSNVDTGATTTDAALTRAPFAVTAAAYANNFAGTTATTLYVIDTQSDRLLIQNPPNNGTLNDVGALGLDADAVSAFEITGVETAGAVLSTATLANGFYSINLSTGTATLVGAITLPLITDRISGLSAPSSATAPAANSTIFAVVNGSALTSFARNAPTLAAAPLPITGMQSGETLLGIDFRPANGSLYGVGSTGRLYTIDTTTALATVAPLLTADGADATDPFSALAGTNFGIDFNPVPDRLRVVSNTGQNLRINVDTGATLTDSALNVPTPSVVAAAYDRNFAGTTTTTLFVLDVATNTLQIQNPPNDGVLSSVGRLDLALTFAATAGFDIAGGDDGLALAVLQPSAALQSSLYRINLRTGAATSLGVIGASGAPLVTAATIRLQ